MRAWVRVCAVGAVLAASSGPGWAQENLEQGKSPAQLFASDCGICHKSALALVKDGYPTEAFLRVHYTSSREMAATLFTYLRNVQRADAASGSKRGKKAKEGEAKPERSAKKPESKRSEKASGAKAEEPKTPEKKAEPEKKE